MENVNVQEEQDYVNFYFGLINSDHLSRYMNNLWCEWKSMWLTE